MLRTQVVGGAPRSGYAPCPLCSSSTAAPVGYSLWGGILGPKLLTHVKCSECGTTYNGKTGQSNATGIAVYLVVSTILAFVLISAALRIVLPMVGSLVPS
jgi:transposase-like protein